MGRYFGLCNDTRNHRISSYWKGDPPTPDEVLSLAHMFGWSVEDKISSGSYCDYYSWSWSQLEWQNDDEIPEESQFDRELSAPPSVITERPELPAGQYDAPKPEDRMSSHAPNWLDTDGVWVCSQCNGRPLDQCVLDKLAQQYDTVYNWN